jgi:hypothetical protein
MKCPHCGGSIRAYRVLPEFSCAECKKTITSNSFTAGLIAGVVAVLIALPFEHTCSYYGSPSWLCGAFIFVGAVAFAYVFIYRPLLRLKPLDKDGTAS